MSRHPCILLLQVEFDRPVDAKGNIEVWLQRLVDGMQDTVKCIIKSAVKNVYEMPLEDTIFQHPAQVTSCLPRDKTAQLPSWQHCIHNLICCTSLHCTRFKKMHLERCTWFQRPNSRCGRRRHVFTTASLAPSPHPVHVFINALCICV
jgi:hypothetical protein